MNPFDTIIRGGTVANASDTVKCDVGIRGGRVVALGVDLGAAAEVIDASGRLVLPGGIDSHVHFAQPSAAPASSWPTISRAAPVRRRSAAIRS